MRKIMLTLDSSQIGGIETHVVTLAVYLLQQGHEVEVLFVREHPGNPLYAQLTQQQIRTRFATSIGDYWRQLRRQRHTIILHTHGYKAGIMGRIFATLLGIPVVSTYHSGDLGSGKLWLYSILDQLTARLGDNIAVSEPIKAALPPSTRVIPNFVAVAGTLAEDSPAQDTPPTPAANAGQDKTLRVAFVGRLSNEKGPDQFCRLAALWQAQAQPQTQPQALEFVIYGDGPLAQELSAQYQGTVDFKGYVKMTRHWHEVDVLCISSRYEGLPYVALEAMALGIPVISFAVGGMADLITSPSLGWLVEAGDIGKLKQALSRWAALSGEDKQQLASRVQDKIRQNYSSAALVPQIEAIYNKYQD